MRCSWCGNPGETHSCPSTGPAPVPTAMDRLDPWPVRTGGPDDRYPANPQGDAL